jgi:phosphosulfolactate synthase
MNFLDLPTYPKKPRDKGITSLFDLFMPVGQQKELLSLAAGVIDTAKFIHIGLAFEDALPPGWLEEKLAIYRAHQIKTYPGGVPYQVALVQDKVEEYFDWLVQAGFDGVELAEDAMSFRVTDERMRDDHIKMALDKGLFVETELGKKAPDDPLDLDYAHETIMHDIELGVSRVAIERSELDFYMDKDPKPLVDLVNAVGLKHVMTEPNPFGWPKYHSWVFSTFGPDVNVGNIQPSEVMYVHLARLGFARFGNFRFFDNYKHKQNAAAQSTAKGLKAAE